MRPYLPVDLLPEGPDCLYEVKLDGYRALGIRSGGRAVLMSRNEKDFSNRYPHVTAALG